MAALFQLFCQLGIPRIPQIFEVIHAASPGLFFAQVFAVAAFTMDIDHENPQKMFDEIGRRAKITPRAAQALG